MPAARLLLRLVENCAVGPKGDRAGYPSYPARPGEDNGEIATSIGRTNRPNMYLANPAQGRIEAKLRNGSDYVLLVAFAEIVVEGQTK
jgi:hypothetical protein